MTDNHPTAASSRTMMLVVIVALALALLTVVGFLVFRPGASTESPGAATESTTAEASSSSTESTPSSAAPTSSTPDHTRPTAAPGSVTYQFTGSGSVVAVGYKSADGDKVLAAAGAPWSVRTTVRGTSAELTAIVVTGTVTCTILHGEDLLASSTSSGGPLVCRAQLPKS
ncbi:hypothetical protein ACFQNE_00160 [Gordonia phosphorivorans]|uniref:MmpS family membrane protein n=1 Tax=Gordonia phosphorivorans TaxID=1056982 RepID=A0ABV6HCW8_9ACTN